MSTPTPTPTPTPPVIPPVNWNDSGSITSFLSALVGLGVGLATLIGHPFNSDLVASIVPSVSFVLAAVLTALGVHSHAQLKKLEYQAKVDAALAPAFNGAGIVHEFHSLEKSAENDVSKAITDLKAEITKLREKLAAFIEPDPAPPVTTRARRPANGQGVGE